MTDDVPDRVRRTRAAVATRSVHTAEMLDRVHRGVRRRRQRRTAALAAVVALGVVAGGTAVLTAGDADLDRAVTTPQPSLAGSSTPGGGASSDVLPTTRSTTVRGVRVQLGPAGFDATGSGALWSVDTQSCADGTLCSSVRRRDRAGVWIDVVRIRFSDTAEAARYALPPVELLRVSDDEANLWAFGQQLWSSHDGGRSWERQELDGANRRDRVEVVSAGDVVFAWQPGPPRLWRSPAGSDSWVSLDPPRTLGYAEQLLTVNGSLVLTGGGSSGDEVHLSEDRGRSWRRVGIPCDRSGTYLRSAGTALFATCQGQGGVPERVMVYRSFDAITWKLLAAVNDRFIVDLLVPVDNDTALVVVDGKPVLLTAGGSHEVSLKIPEAGRVLAGKFTHGTGHVLVTPPQRLLQSTDGGRSWRTVG